jgi:hypothetical protein
VFGNDNNSANSWISSSLRAPGVELEERADLPPRAIADDQRAMCGQRL